MDSRSRDGCLGFCRNGQVGRGTYRTLLGATVWREDVNARAIARATDYVSTKQQPKDRKNCRTVK